MMTHFDFYFADKKSRQKSIYQAMHFMLFYIVSSVVMIYIIALLEPVGGMTDYEFIYKLCIFIGAPLIGAAVFAVWCVRMFCSKSIGVNVYEDKLEIVRYYPLGYTFKLKLVIPFSSIEKIEITTVNDEILKKTQYQIHMMPESECVVIKTTDKAAVSFCTTDNAKLVEMVKATRSRSSDGE